MSKAFPGCPSVTVQYEQHTNIRLREVVQASTTGIATRCYLCSMGSHHSKES